MDTPTRSDLATFLGRHGLANVADELAAAALPCVRMHLTASTDADIEVGASKLFGSPDLPAGFVWPRRKGKRLQLLVQIRCEDAAPFDVTTSLPRAGYLWFFYDVDEQPWGCDPSDRGAWVVRYVAEAGELERADDGGDAEDPLGRPCTLAFRSALTLPSWERRAVDLTDDQVDTLRELPGEDDAPLVCSGHRLLGFPTPVQSDEMEEECQMISRRVDDARGYLNHDADAPPEEPKRWRLLLQLDSDDDAGVMWGDCGTLYFWIPEDSLATRRFEDVWMVLQCG